MTSEEIDPVKKEQDRILDWITLLTEQWRTKIAETPWVPAWHYNEQQLQSQGAQAALNELATRIQQGQKAPLADDCVQTT